MTLSYNSLFLNWLSSGGKKKEKTLILNADNNYETKLEITVFIGQGPNHLRVM